MTAYDRISPTLRGEASNCFSAFFDPNMTSFVPSSQENASAFKKGLFRKTPIKWLVYYCMKEAWKRWVIAMSHYLWVTFAFKISKNPGQFEVILIFEKMTHKIWLIKSDTRRMMIENEVIASLCISSLDCIWSSLQSSLFATTFTGGFLIVTLWHGWKFELNFLKNRMKKYNFQMVEKHVFW